MERPAPAELSFPSGCLARPSLSHSIFGIWRPRCGLQKLAKPSKGTRNLVSCSSRDKAALQEPRQRSLRRSGRLTTLGQGRQGNMHLLNARPCNLIYSLEQMTKSASSMVPSRCHRNISCDCQVKGACPCVKNSLGLLRIQQCSFIIGPRGLVSDLKTWGEGLQRGRGNKISIPPDSSICLCAPPSVLCPQLPPRLSG